MSYSFIIPVYNRPIEVDELLETIANQSFEGDFEVVVIEDGSTLQSKEICDKYADRLHITYLYKPNSGPGDSRNYGMQKAHYDYFIILDSDCLLPEHYLESVDDFLKRQYVDCFGGADAADESFTDIQKAINYAMTSLLTTGGIRGNKNGTGKFQPRSFNMGLSRKAFESSGGFGRIHPGEDPDLVIRLWQKGYQTAFIEEAFVYHKRRISWKKFKEQVCKFGQTRAILNHWYPQTKKITFWLPFLFSTGLIFSLSVAFIGRLEGLYIYCSYFIIVLLHSSRENKSTKIGFLTIWAILVQFFSYGFGFFRATTKLFLYKKEPEKLFPHLFFRRK